jgi:hypothetical protein
MTDRGIPGPEGHAHSAIGLKATLRLNTIAEARARYNAWAAVEFDRVHSGPRGGWLDTDGQMHEDPAPENPYRTKELAR